MSAPTIEGQDVASALEQMIDLFRRASSRAISSGDLTPDMLEVIVRNHGPFQELVIAELAGIARKISMAGKMVRSDILEPFATVSVSGIEGFSPRASFKLGTNNDVTIVFLDPSFMESLVLPGATEFDLPAQKLRAYQFTSLGRFEEIIQELGGERVVTVSLATVFELIKKQGSGQKGDLVIGPFNFFFVRNQSDELSLVVCNWLPNEGWHIVLIPSPFPVYSGGNGQVHRIFAPCLNHS